MKDIEEQKKNEAELYKYSVHLKKLVAEKKEELILYQEKLENKVKERTIQFQQSEERYRRLVECSDDLIIRYDNQFKYLFVNPIFKNITGIKPGNAIGKTNRELGFSIKFCKLYEKALLKCFETEKKYQIEIKFPNNRWFDLTIIPELNIDKEVFSLITTAHDITERKKIAEYNKHLLIETQKLVDMKSNLISTASHEFRTPLSTILISTELLELCDKKWSTENKAVHFNRIKNNIKNLRELLQDSTKMSTEGNSEIFAKNQYLNINSLAKSLIEEAKNSMAKKSKINFLSNKKESEIFINKLLLREILLNLLTNAIKYTSIEKQIWFKTELMANNVKFIVSDEGIGIPKLNQPIIFNQFARGDNVGTISGTGMGLGIVEKAVKSLNGNISFTSEVGIGSTFEVEIPLKKDI